MLVCRLVKNTVWLSQLIRQPCKTRRPALNPQQQSKLQRLMQRPLCSQSRRKKRQPQQL